MKIFNHIQSSPAMTWTITHNFAQKPVGDIVVDIGGGVREKILPLRITHIDNNTFQVDFSIARSGVARLAATGSLSPSSSDSDVGSPINGTIIGSFSSVNSSAAVPTTETLQSPALYYGSTGFVLYDSFTGSGELNGRSVETFTPVITHGRTEIALSARRLTNSSTGLTAGTNYTVDLVVNGVLPAQTVTVNGTQAQTYLDFMFAINSQITGAVIGLYDNKLSFQSLTTGATSSLSIINDLLFSQLSDYVSLAATSGTQGNGSQFVWGTTLTDPVGGGVATLVGTPGQDAPEISVTGEFASPAGIFFEAKFNASTLSSVFLVDLSIGNTSLSLAFNENPGSGSAVRVDARGFNRYTKPDGSLLDPTSGDTIVTTSASFSADRYYSVAVDSRNKVVRAELTSTSIKVYVDNALVLSQVPRWNVQLFATASNQYSTNLSSLTMSKSGSSDNIAVDYVRVGAL